MTQENLNNFREIETVGELATFLGITSSELVKLTKLDSRKLYYQFEIKKRSGGKRTIHAPAKRLKEIQKILASAFQEVYTPPREAHGYILQRGILTNSQSHIKRRIVFQVDLEDFFPSIHIGRVRGLLQSSMFNFSHEVADALAKLCTVRVAYANSHLPQGAPTSPILSNFICYKLDKNLQKLARSNRCYYSRYADDISFSTDRATLPTSIAVVENTAEINAVKVGLALKIELVNQGFKINHEKTRMKTKRQRQMVTGIVVNEKMNVPRDFVRQTRDMLYFWKKYGAESAGRHYFKYVEVKNRPPGKPDPLYRQVVKGRVQYIGSVKGWTDPTYIGLGRALDKLDSTFNLQIQRYKVHTNQITLYGEGPTDCTHLKAALRYFNKKLMYENLNINFSDPAQSSKKGDNNLLTKLENFAEQKQPAVTIFMFDRDVSETISRVTDSTGKPKDWGNNVYSFAIPYPEHRNEGELICIEHYYLDEDLLKEDHNGRRLYMLEEFNRSNGLHKSRTKYRPHPPSTLIIDEQVYDIPSGNNIALPKAHFAKYVFDQVEPFDEMNLEAFAKIFDTIIEIYDLQNK